MRTSFGNPSGAAGAPQPATRTAPPPPRGGVRVAAPTAAPAPVAAAPVAQPAPAARPAPVRRQVAPVAPVAAVVSPAPAPVAPPVVEVQTEVVPPVTETAVVAAPKTRVRRTKAEMQAAQAAAGTANPEPVAPGQSTAVVAYEPPRAATGGIPAVGEIAGVVEASDLILPQLKIANAVGPLSQLNPPVPPGTIVVGSGEQWIYLFQEWQERNAQSGQLETFQSPPVGVTIVWAKKQFGQVTDDQGKKLYGQDDAPSALTFDTKEEMQAAGGMIGSPIPGMLGFEPQLTCYTVIRMPEGLEDDLGLFNIERPEGLFAAAMWYIRGTSYGECAKKIFTEKTGFLAGGSHTAEFDMAPKRIIGKLNSWFVPTLANGGYHTPETVEYLANNA